MNNSENIFFILNTNSYYKLIKDYKLDINENIQTVGLELGLIPKDFDALKKGIGLFTTKSTKLEDITSVRSLLPSTIQNVRTLPIDFKIPLDLKENIIKVQETEDTVGDRIICVRPWDLPPPKRKGKPTKELLIL